MKKFVRILLYLFGLVLILAIAAAVLVYSYEEEVTQFAVEKIQGSLATQAHVEEVELSLWESFPHASIKMTNVLIEETFAEHDTLLHAGALFLEFNVWDFVTGNYVVNEISVDDAYVNIKRKADGTDNYHFWNAGAENEDGEFLFELEQVNLSNSRAGIQDDKAEFYLRLDEGDFSIAALLDELKIRIEGDASFVMHEVSIGGERFVAEKEIVTDLNIEINNGDKAYYIDESEITVQGVPIGLNGSIMDLPEGVLCDLNLSGHLLSIDDLVADLPETYGNAIAGYRLGGLLTFSGSVSGLAGVASNPEVTAQFAISRGQIEHRNSGVAFSGMEASGSFEKKDGAAEKLVVDALKAGFGSGTFALNGVLAEFAKPWIDVKVQGDFDLNDLREFAELNQLDELSGRFGISADFEGKLGEHWALSPYILNHLKIDGKVDFEDASFRLHNSAHAYESLTGVFSLNNQDAQIEQFSGVVENSDFSLTGYFRNFVPFLLLEKEMLHIDATVSSSRLDFNTLFASEGGGGEAGGYHLAFPSNVDFTATLAVYELHFREFHATNLRGKAVLKDQRLTLNPTSLRTSDGFFEATAVIDGSTPGKFVFDCSSDLEDIQLDQLFAGFENFGQTYLTDKHLKGRAVAHVDFKATFDDALNCDPKSIVSVVDITIRDGELINLSSLRDVSSYVGSHALLGPLADEEALEKKLAHVYFDELENRIEIRNQQILIPKMIISSSAMDISAEGVHTFNNDIDYTVGFKIRDVLSRSNETEFGTVEDDGLSNSFFLSMRGPADDPEFGYDRLAHREKRKEDRKNEAQNVKQILKDELSLFKKSGDDQPQSTVTGGNDQTVITVGFDDAPAKEEQKQDKRKRGFLKNAGNTEEEGQLKITIEDEEDDF